MEPVIVSEDSGAEKSSEELDPTSQESEGEPVIGADSPSNIAVASFIEPAEAEVNPGLHFPGNSSFSFSPSLSLIINQCSLAGLDWVAGLKNLSLSGLPCEGFTSSGVNRVKVSEALEGIPVEPSASPSSDFAPLLSDLSLAPEPDPGRGGGAALLSSPESSESGYFLRSSLKKSGGGLGKDQQPVRKGRGRISHLSKAQLRAKADLREGKQLSIERALRAVNARRHVRK